MRDPNCEILITTELLLTILQLNRDGFEMARGTSHDEAAQTLRLRMYAAHLHDVRVAEPLHLITPVYRRVQASETVLDVVNVQPGPERTDAHR